MYTNKRLNSMELEMEYSPSLNTKRFQEFPKPQEKILDNFVNVTKTETERMRNKYKMRENVHYGTNVENVLFLNDNKLLDIYYKEQEFDTPIFVYIHGGYWQQLDKSSSGSFVSPLVELGYRVLLVDYNLCPQVTLKQLTEQIVEFFLWLFQYATQTNASEISLCGHSAGAHLLTFLFSDKRLSEFPIAERLKNIFLISGVYDLRELWQLECVNTQNILNLNAQMAKNLSPICWNNYNDVTMRAQKLIKFHVLVGANESETFREQSRIFAEKLIKLTNANAVKFKVFENYDHFDIIENVAVNGTTINQYICNFS